VAVFGIAAAEGQYCIHSEVYTHQTFRLASSHSLPSNLGIVQQHNQGHSSSLLGVGGAFFVSKWLRITFNGVGRQSVLISCIVITAVYLTTLKCMSID